MALLVIDVSKELKRQHARQWIEDLNQALNEQGDMNDSSHGIAIILVANKIDTPNRQVSPEQVKELFQSLKNWNNTFCTYFEVSCKTGHSLQQMQTYLQDLITRSYVKRKQSGQINHKPDIVPISLEPEDTSRSWCTVM